MTLPYAIVLPASGGGELCCTPGRRKQADRRLNSCHNNRMDDLPIVPPIMVKDTPKPQRLPRFSSSRTSEIVLTL